MKKKLIGLLLVLSMMLAVTGIALAQAVPHVDPNECLHCGFGSVITTTTWTGNFIDNPDKENVDCKHGSPLLHKDIYLLEIGETERKCDVCLVGTATTIYRSWVQCTYTGQMYLN